MVMVVISKEHGRENLGPEDSEAANHDGEDDHSLGVAEETCGVTGLMLLLLNVLRLKHQIKSQRRIPILTQGYHLIFGRRTFSYGLDKILCSMTKI